MAATQLQSLEQLCSILSALPKTTQTHVGQMVSLGLDAVEERVGPERWERMRDLVGQFVEKAINNLCGPTDTYLKTKDGGFVIVFSRLSESAALARAAAIAKQVNESLFGSDGFEGAQLRGVVSDGKSWTADEEMTPSAVADLLARGAMRAEATAEQEGILVVKKDDESEDVKRTRLHDAFLSEMRTIGQASVHHVFNPVWSVPAGAIAAFRCLPAKKLDFDNTISLGYGVLPPGTKPAELAKLDSEALDAGLLALMTALRAGAKTDLVVNLHFDTLSGSGTRERIAESLRATPEALRQRLFIKIFGIPCGVPTGRLQEMVQFASPFCRGTCVILCHDAVQVNINETMLRLRQANIKVLGVDLPARPTKLDLSWTKSILHTAQDLGFVSYAGNLQRWDHVLELAEADIALMSGLVFGASEVDVPARRPLTLEDVRRFALEPSHSMAISGEGM